MLFLDRFHRYFRNRCGNGYCFMGSGLGFSIDLIGYIFPEVKWSSIDYDRFCSWMLGAWLFMAMVIKRKKKRDIATFSYIMCEQWQLSI